MSSKFKSVVGLADVYVALVTQDDADGYVAAAPEAFAPAIEANAEPSTSEETQYADNKPFDVLTGEGETKITMKVTNIPVPMQAKCLGKVFDVASGRMFDNGSGAVPPDMALSFRVLKSDGTWKYFQYLKGRFSVPKDEAATSTDKKEPKPAEIVYTAVNTIHEFDLGDIIDSMKRVVGDESDLNFSATGFFLQVQTPNVVAPSALALSTSNPADGATGVAVDANIVLTFNNALIDAAINQVVLIRASTGALTAAACSLDATKKILTVNPGSNLEATEQYFVAISVADIYGQHLNVVNDFTTA